LSSQESLEKLEQVVSMFVEKSYRREDAGNTVPLDLRKWRGKTNISRSRKMRTRDNEAMQVDERNNSSGRSEDFADPTTSTTAERK
jgi:hypothetical protein